MNTLSTPRDVKTCFLCLLVHVHGERRRKRAKANSGRKTKRVKTFKCARCRRLIADGSSFKKSTLVMVALCNRAYHYIFAL